MKNYIWDGEIDMGWEDMKSYLIEVSNKFIQKVLILANQSNNIVVKKLVNEKSMQRFEAVIDALTKNEILDIVRSSNRSCIASIFINIY